MHEPQRKTQPPSVTASGERNVSAGRDIHAPIFLGNITNSVVKITSALPPLLRVVLLAILSLAALTLIGVAILIVRAVPSISTDAPPPTPDPNRLAGIVPGLNVTALAMGTGSELWVGARSGEQSALYRLDTALGARATPQRMLDVEGEIAGLTVDCRGNVWLLLTDVGVLAYQPRTGQRRLFSPETANELMTKKTIQAVEVRCPDQNPVVTFCAQQDMQVWLGRERVRTLCYGGDYPTPETTTYVPIEMDPVYAASQKLLDVRALRYVTATQTLWIANLNGQLLSISLKGVLPPQLFSLQDTALWSLGLSPEGVVWAGGSQNFYQMVDQGKVIPLVQSDGKRIDTQARFIAVGRQQVWLGGRCAESAATCRPLWVFNQGPSRDSLYGVDRVERKEVRGIVIDPTGAVWIGTSPGPIIYATSDK